jgi:small-conductance mechanosensitive channel
MTRTDVLAFSVTEGWNDFWRGEIGVWILTKGLEITLLVIGAILAARGINWAARKVTHRLEENFETGDTLVRSEASKHRQAVANVISWVCIVLLFVVVATQITNVLSIPVGSLVAPAAVLGAALGFGAQKVVQDLLSGFFIITERQYGFGDLVQVSMVGAPDDAQGTVEEVTLRVTKLRTADGEVFTIPNGNIVRSLNLSKDWARAVIDIPVPVTADLTRVNELLHDVGSKSMEDPRLKDLLLDEPSLMGVENIGLENVNLRMVARTLPGKQFEASRRLRVLILRALTAAGVVNPTDAAPIASAMPQSGAAGLLPSDDRGTRGSQRPDA